MDTHLSLASAAVLLFFVMDPLGNIPLFLSAQGSPIPELQRIIVSDGNRTAMANTLREAVASMFGTMAENAAGFVVRGDLVVNIDASVRVLPRMLRNSRLLPAFLPIKFSQCHQRASTKTTLASS